jgi:LAS superfamily LD-carboxypeptidase LdcB
LATCRILVIIASMKNSDVLAKFDPRKILLASIFIALALSGLVAYQYWDLKDEYKFLIGENEDLSSKLAASEDENEYLLSKNAEQQAIIDSFHGQISDIGKTVGTLEKIANTDEELLKKYSKVYFLNENYIPKRLYEIEKEYVFNGTTNYMILADVWPFLKKMLDDAKEDGVEILVASAYRSFGTQAALKSNYTVLYGSGANQFSADQGYSEHQLGTSLDFTTSNIGAVFSKFSSEEAYLWLKANAHRYGFTLSYPENNTYYKFEPWHWRFVGIELATYLFEEKKSFYDVSQRTIDAYLVRLFDKPF